MQENCSCSPTSFVKMVEHAHKCKNIFESKCLWSNVAHGCEHGDSAVLQLCLTTSLEVLHATVCGESCGVPKPNGFLHTKLVLEGAQRRCSVVGPVTPGASGQTILYDIRASIHTGSLQFQLKHPSTKPCNIYVHYSFTILHIYIYIRPPLNLV